MSWSGRTAARSSSISARRRRLAGCRRAAGQRADRRLRGARAVPHRPAGRTVDRRLRARRDRLSGAVRRARRVPAPSGCAARRCRSPWTAPASTPRRCVGRSTGRSPLMSTARPQSVADWSAALESRRGAAARPRLCREPRRSGAATTIHRPCGCGGRRTGRADAAGRRGAAAAGHDARPAARRVCSRHRAPARSAPASPARPGTAGRCTSATSRPTGWSIRAAAATLSTIADAIARAGDGATIAIRPGTYDESLTIDAPLHLVPAVPDTPPLIAPTEGPCVTATGAGGSISGLRLRPAPRRTIRPQRRALPAASELGPARRGQSDPRRRRPGDPGARRRRAGDRRQRHRTAAGAGIVVTAGAAPQITQNTICRGRGPAP